MKKITATQKVILEFYMEIWYCYDYENGSMANPLFTSTSYELADAEAKDAGYEVVQVIEFEDEEETELAPTPTSKEGLEDGGFTKGDWEANIDHSREAGAYPKTYVSCNGKAIAICYDKRWTIGVQEAEANARLIAAAPAMFEALNEVINHCNFICAAHGGDIYEKMMEHKSIKKAEAILTRINKD